MFMFDPHYMLQFPTLQPAVLRNPDPVSIYGLFSATVIVVCLRSLANQRPIKDISSLRLCFMLGLRICTNLLTLLFIFLDSYSF
jgi:hypothetical protein